MTNASCNNWKNSKPPHLILLSCSASSRRPSKLDVSKIIFPLIRLALNVLLCLQLRATGGAAAAAVRGTTRRGEAALQHESGEWLLNAAGKCVMWATLSKLLKPCFDVNFCNGLAWPSLSPPPPSAATAGRRLCLLLHFGHNFELACFAKIVLLLRQRLLSLSFFLLYRCCFEST